MSITLGFDRVEIVDQRISVVSKDIRSSTGQVVLIRENLKRLGDSGKYFVNSLLIRKDNIDKLGGFVGYTVFDPKAFTLASFLAQIHAK